MASTNIYSIGLESSMSHSKHGARKILNGASGHGIGESTSSLSLRHVDYTWNPQEGGMRLIGN